MSRIYDAFLEKFELEHGKPYDTCLPFPKGWNVVGECLSSDAEKLAEDVQLKATKLGLEVAYIKKVPCKPFEVS